MTKISHDPRASGFHHPYTSTPSLSRLFTMPMAFLIFLFTVPAFSGETKKAQSTPSESSVMKKDTPSPQKAPSTATPKVKTTHQVKSVNKETESTGTEENLSNIMIWLGTVVVDSNFQDRNATPIIHEGKEDPKPEKH